MSSSADDRVDGEPREVAAWFARLPDPEARDELARAFLPLAEHIARRFGGRGESVDDLTQVASMALLHAIDRFDPGREVRFSTFATVTILGELKRHFRDRGWAIRVPRNLQETSLLVNGILAELWQELGRAPTVQDVADRAHLSLDDVLEAMEAAQAYATSSLDAPVGDEGITVGDAIGGPDEALAVSEDWASVEPAIRRLPPRERTILYLRFFRGMTQSEIADRIGISQMHVSRLLSNTLRWLRRESVDATEAEPGPGS